VLSLKKILFFFAVLISFSISAQKDSTQIDDLKIKGKIFTKYLVNFPKKVSNGFNIKSLNV